MFRRTKQIGKAFAVAVFACTVFLSGVPSQGFVDMLAERNIVDVLYHAMQDPNVIDKGLTEMFAPHVERAHAATFSMQTGYYIGNATDNRTITGVGFSPDLVLLKDNTAGGAEGMIIKTATMAGELALALSETDAALSTNHIQSLNADGFTVGTDADANGSNVMFHWAAFDGSDCSSSGTFCVGSYTGNGGTQNITSVGFQPDLVIVKRSGASVGVWGSSSMAASTTNFFHNATQDTTGAYISGYLSNGFSVGNNAAVSTNGNTFYYVAFKQVSGAMDVGTFTGNAGESRNITSADDAGLTFQPDFVFVKNANAATAQNAVASMHEHYGDRSVNFNDVASAANQIQELRSAGGFQVGTAATVNGSGNAIYYAAFSGASPKAAGTGTFTMTNGTYTGTGTGFSISGLGFAPDLVIIKHNDQATDQHAVWRSRTMPGNMTMYFGLNATSFTNGITALGTDGFTVGTAAQVNTASDVYYWTAFGNAMKPDLAGGSSDFLIGAYIGDNVDNRNIDRLPIEPDFVAVKRLGSTVGNWRTANQSGDQSLYFSAAPQTANAIQALNADGFQRGTLSGAVNTAGSTYHYFAFATSSRFAIGTYTGTGASRSVTSAGFQPDHLWVKKTTGGTARGGVLRTSAQTGDAAQPFLAAPTVANAITALIFGGFSATTGLETNENTFTYQYAAWDAKQYTHQAYRFFANINSTDVGVALAAADSPATLSSAGEAFRLRTLIRVDEGNLFGSGQDFKLQFAGKGGGSCASPSGTPSSYTDVTGATVIAYNDNGAVADGASLTVNANDPTDGGRTIVNQTYEESNVLTNSQAAINDIQDGKWDFALKDNGAPQGTTYCFRVVESDDTEVKMISRPEITTAAGGNAAPSVTSVSIDSAAAAVTLIEGTTKNVVCAGTVTDTDGFADIDAVESLFFRTGVGTSSADDNNNKYTQYGDSQCVPSGGSGNTETYTCTSSVWYYADATDAGSPNSADTWTCEMRASDGTATSTAGTDTIEMASLIALDVDSAIDYGTMAPGSGNTSETVTVTNTGNRDMDPQLSGTNMTSGGDTIGVGQQGYKTFPFSLNCGEGTDLSGTPTAVDITLPQRTSESTAVTDTLYWCLDVPNGSPTGSYGGTNTFTAIAGL